VQRAPFREVAGGSSMVTNTMNDSIASMTTMTMKRWSTNFATRASRSGETAGPAASRADKAQVERGEAVPPLSTLSSERFFWQPP